MSFLASPLSHALTTPLSTSDAAQAIALLHTHAFMIKCNPLVTSHTLLSTQSIPFPSKSISPDAPAHSSSTSEWHTYSISESIPHLGGVFHQSVPSLVAFENTSNGVVTKVKAPGGLDIESEWTIKKDGEGNGDGKGEKLELVETAKGTCFVLLAGKVNASMAKNYGVIHQRFVQELMKGKGEGSDGGKS